MDNLSPIIQHLQSYLSVELKFFSFRLWLGMVYVSGVTLIWYDVVQVQDFWNFSSTSPK